MGIKPLLFSFLIALTLFSIVLAQDVNNDGVVDKVDLVIVSRAFETRPGDSRWDPRLDLNKDGIINILDVAIVANQVNKPKPGFFSWIVSVFRSVQTSIVNYFSSSGSCIPSNIPINVNVTPQKIINQDLVAGKEFNVSITVENVNCPGLWAYEFKLYYSNTLLEAVKAWIPDNHFMTPVNSQNIWVQEGGTINQEEGHVYFALTLKSDEPGKTTFGKQVGVLANVTFKVKTIGSSDLVINEVVLADSDTKEITNKDITNGVFDNKFQPKCNPTTPTQCTGANCKWCYKCESIPGRVVDQPCVKPGLDCGYCVRPGTDCGYHCDINYCQAQCVVDNNCNSPPNSCYETPGTCLKCVCSYRLTKCGQGSCSKGSNDYCSSCQHYPDSVCNCNENVNDNKEDCPVEITGISVSDKCPKENTHITIRCSSNPANVNCVMASIDNKDCTLKPGSQDEFDCAVGSYTTQTCNTGNTYTVKCYVQADKCNQKGLDKTDQVYSVKSSCSAYSNSNDCTGNGCEWCLNCKDNKYSGFDLDQCVDSGNCKYNCKKDKCNAACNTNEQCLCNQQDGCSDNYYYQYPTNGQCKDDCSCDTGTDQGKPCEPIIKNCFEKNQTTGYCKCSCGAYIDHNGENTISCSDEKDNDCDGLTDRADPDCVSAEDCSNNVDDDNDGSIDCQDGTDCPAISCPTCKHSVCDANYDWTCQPDSSGTDCGDCRECDGNGNCNYKCSGSESSCECVNDQCIDCSNFYGTSCGSGRCSSHKKPTNWQCSSGVCSAECKCDVSCSGSQCDATRSCPGTQACNSDCTCAGGVENCNNNVDDDNDGKIDCQDPDCPSSINCGTCQVLKCNANGNYDWTCESAPTGTPCGGSAYGSCKQCDSNGECKWACLGDECCYWRNKACTSHTDIGDGFCVDSNVNLCYVYSEKRTNGEQCCSGNWMNSCEISVSCSDVDLDDNGMINIVDIAQVAKYYRLCDTQKYNDCNNCITNSYGTTFCYETKYDINKDGRINLIDVVLVANYYNRRC